MSERAPPLSACCIVRNAVIFDYPIQVALRSVLPLCEELLVNVGSSRDGTPDLVRELDDRRIRVFENEWGDPRGRRATELAEQTNWVLDRCRHEWALYVQADEVLHEEDYPAVRAALERAAMRSDAEGLAFDYLHFYGSPQWILSGRRVYRAEVRLVRRNSGIRSRGDAQGFRVAGRRPRVIRSGARIFHYGYAKSRSALDAKLKLGALWWGEDPESAPPFEFERPRELRLFDGTHPAVAVPWIESRQWPYDPAHARRPRWTLREVRRGISDGIEQLTARRPFDRPTFRLIG